MSAVLNNSITKRLVIIARNEVTKQSHLLYILTILIMLFSCSHDVPDYEAPDFILPDVYGNNVHLYSMLSQGPVVIIPWALWCKMCIKELDAFRPYADELHSSMRIHILAISQDRSRAAPNVLPFAIEHEWICHYRILLDTANVVRDLYNIQAMPSTIAISQNGEIVFTWMGYKPGDELIIIDSLEVLFGK